MRRQEKETVAFSDKRIGYNLSQRFLKRYEYSMMLVEGKVVDFKVNLE